MRERYRLAVLVSHPVQYYYQLYRELAGLEEVELTVYFCWEGETGGAVYEPNFQTEVSWDLPLLEGYTHRFLKNYSPDPFLPFFGFINPGIVSELGRNRYDAVFVWGYSHLSSWLAFFGAALWRTPLFLGGSVTRRPGERRGKRLVKRAILSPLFKRTAAFLSECDKNSDYYLFYGGRREKVFSVPAAVDNDYFRGQAQKLAGDKPELKAELGLPPGEPVILYVGSFTPNKRVGDLVEAYRMIANETGASLILVGEGEEHEEIVRRIREAGLSRARIVGFQNQTNLPRYYGAADLLVLPSRLDFSPRVVNEAMNFALPVVVSDGVGTAGDLVIEGENGFIFPAGDIPRLAKKLSLLLQDPARREKMGVRGREEVSKWNYRVAAEEILRALRSLRAGKRPGYSR